MKIYEGEIVEVINKLISLTQKFSEEHFNSIPLWTPSILSKEHYSKTQYEESFSDKGNGIYNKGELVAHHCPTGCYNVYAKYDNSILSGDIGYTLVNKCFRNEVDETHDLNFTVFESVHLGDEIYILEVLNKAVNFQTQLLDFCGVKWKLVRTNDPFFGKDSEKKGRAQRISGSKLELQVKKDDRWIALTSYNNLGSVMFGRFNIETGLDINNPSSCCWGWGIERTVEYLYGDYITLPSDLDDFEYEPTNKSIYMNTLKNQIGWSIIDGLSYWFGEKDIREVEDGNNEDGFVIIDSMEAVNKYEQELKLGIKNMNIDLSGWPAVWNFEDLKNRINSGCVMYVNILDGKAAQWQWFWFDEFVITDHDWELDVKLSKDKAYSGHWWVNPKYRFRRNLYRNFYKNLWTDLKNRGIKLDVSYVDGWNSKAITIGDKIGYVGSDWILEEELLK